MPSLLLFTHLYPGQAKATGNSEIVTLTFRSRGTSELAFSLMVSEALVCITTSSVAKYQLAKIVVMMTSFLLQRSIPKRFAMPTSYSASSGNSCKRLRVMMWQPRCFAGICTIFWNLQMRSVRVSTCGHGKVMTPVGYHR